MSLQDTNVEGIFLYILTYYETFKVNFSNLKKCFVFKKCQHNYFVYNPQSEYLIMETLSLSTSQYKQDMLTSKICKAKVKYVSIYSRYSVLLSAHSQKRNMIFIYIHYDGKVFNEDNTIFMGQVFLRKYCGIV